MLKINGAQSHISSGLSIRVQYSRYLNYMKKQKKLTIFFPHRIHYVFGKCCCTSRLNNQIDVLSLNQDTEKFIHRLSNGVKLIKKDVNRPKNLSYLNECQLKAQNCNAYLFGLIFKYVHGPFISNKRTIMF